MTAEQLQIFGWLLFYAGLRLFICGVETCPVFERHPEETPEKPMEVPGAPGVPRIPPKETR